MSKDLISISGIRLSHAMACLSRKYVAHQGNGRADKISFLYEDLAGEGININCLGLENTPLGKNLVCAQDRVGYGDDARVISVYPHRENPILICQLLELFALHKIHFIQMISSNSMVSFVVSQEVCERALSMLELAFGLDSSRPAFEEDFHDETRAFVRQRYQETRAFYEEIRIKTYGFQVARNMHLTGISCFSKLLLETDRFIQGMSVEGQINSGCKLLFTAGFFLDTGNFHLYFVTDEKFSPAQTYLSGNETAAKKDDKAITTHGQNVDLISFHGPHFGDRFGIFNTAMTCLNLARIPVILAGCTGASINIVLGSGRADSALAALEKGFITP